MTEVAQKTHALLSPSGAHRWTRCPGSVVLEQGQPDNAGYHAEWGTVCHEVADIILQDALAPKALPEEKLVKGAQYWNQYWDPQNAEGFIGRVFTVGGKEYEFDHEMADCVNDYIAHVGNIWEPGDILLPECQVPLEQITGEKDATGTSDCIIIKNNEIVVIDLKTGKGVMVDAEENEQGLMYAAGAIIEQDLLYGPFDRVRIVIIQPRLQHVSEWTLGMREFEHYLEGIAGDAGRVAEAQLFWQDHGPSDEHGHFFSNGFLNPGEKQCRFCKAKAICPALKGEVSAAMGLTAPPARLDEFPDLTLAKQAAAVADKEVVEAADPDALARAWKALPLVEQWVQAVRDAVHARLHDGQPVGDLCLYEGRQGNRVWADEKAAEAALKAARLKADEMYNRKVISPPAAEKLLKEKPRVWAKLAPLITRGDGKPVVGVAGDAKRSPWSPARIEEFPDLSAGDDLFS